MENTKPCLTLAVIGKSLTTEDGEPLRNPTPYRSIIGALQYLTNTRPDIVFIVNRLSQFLQSPTTLHWLGAKRVLRCLKGTQDMGLHIKFSRDLIYKVPQIQIMLVVLTIEDLQLDIVCILETPWSHGPQRSKMWSLGPMQSQSIVLWPRWHVS